MKKTRLKPQSKKQIIKDREWRRVTLLKWEELGQKCQWCDNHTIDPVGHHIIKRSKGRIDTAKNCYPCHQLPCHQFITDKNINVLEIPNLLAYKEVQDV